MELACDECQTVIQIPEKRVPLNTTFRVTCPRCKRKIIANSNSYREEADTADTSSFAEPLVEELTPEGEASEEFSSETMDTMYPGQPICLLCIDQEKGRLSLKFLMEGMGYMVDCSPSPHHALQRLRFNQYHVIVLGDGFGGRSPNPVASYLAKLNMNTRRDTFVVLLGEQFKTADHWQAFVESVDLVCHPVDILQLSAILKRALSEHERFYKVFNECLITAGKKI